MGVQGHCRSYVLRTVHCPGCKYFGICVFEECISLAQIGYQRAATNQLAPQAQFRPQAFEKCSALLHLDFEQTEYDPANLYRCQPECCFLEARIVSLLPADFNWIGSAACELCKRLQSADLSRTEVSEILGSTFAYMAPLDPSFNVGREEAEANTASTVFDLQASQAASYIPGSRVVIVTTGLVWDQKGQSHSALNTHMENVDFLISEEAQQDMDLKSAFAPAVPQQPFFRAMLGDPKQHIVLLFFL